MTSAEPPPRTAEAASLLPAKSARWRKWLVWLLVLVILGASGFAFWRYQNTHRPPDVQYKTAAITEQRIVGKITASGTLQAVVTVQVGSQVSGRLSAINVDFNSPVKKGQLIAKIDPQLFEASAAQARANYLSAQAGLVQAQAKLLDSERVFDRTTALYAQNLAAKMDVDTAETNRSVARAGIDVAKASLAQASAQLNQAQVNLSYTNIMSPIDGVVISRNVDVGQTVAASLSAPVLFTIAEDLKKMQVNTNIAEGDVGRLAQDMPARFTVDAFPGQSFKGTISQIRNASQTIQNVVTYNAVIDVVNADLKLRPGMTANVTVIYDQREKALAVPNTALRFRPPSAAAASTPRTRGQGGAPADDSKTVWVLRGGAPAAVSIKTGLSDGSQTEVVSGELKAGDEVIVDSTTTAGAANSATAAPTGTMRMRL
ncbi:MAG TPA: efflux RND transporter periplasmic adaptor subunit [Polyangiaceae bacterium]